MADRDALLDGALGYETKPLRVSAAQDKRDEATVLAVYGPALSRCVGGRLIVKGYVCPHCHSGSPSSYCPWARIGSEDD